MWAQMITARMKPGRENLLAELVGQLKAAEEPGSGLVHSTAARDVHDPDRLVMFVVFESEEKARARESDPARQERLTGARATMAELFDGPPDFTDLNVVEDWTP